MLKSVPTIVVEERLEGDAISHYLGCWNVMEDFRYQKVFSINWKEVLYPLARQYAREWGRIRNRKLNDPHSEYAKLTSEQLRERFIKEGGDDEVNFQKLEEEEENRRHGERIGYDYRYHVNDEKYVKELAQFLTVCHGIIIGLAVDSYYLTNYSEPPILPELLPDLMQRVPHKDLKLMLFDAVFSHYRSLV